MKSVALKFDVGDKVYRMYGEKVMYASILEVQIHRIAGKDGQSGEHKVKYQVKNQDPSGYTAWVMEDTIGATQAELFNLVRLTGPDHDEDLWTQVFGPPGLGVDKTDT
jgi:methyltransferase-like protein